MLERLVGLGSSFDAASCEEVSGCLDAGARPEAISFGNTIKKVSAIRAAFARGVTLFAFDSAEELEKLAEHAPGARVYCRILVENEGADWPLSRKFGTTVENARELMLRAGEMGLDPYGLSFHVGSQQTTTRAYEVAIAQGGDAVHRPDRGRREPAHDEPGRRLPDALPRSGAGDRPVRRCDHDRR